MKKIYILLFSIISSFSFSQDKICVDNLQAKIIDNIKMYPSNQLLPYYSDDMQKWGYFHKTSGKKLTEPLMDHINLFNPSTRFYFNCQNYSECCTVELMGSAQNYSVLKAERYFEGKGDGSFGIATHRNAKQKIKEGLNGFEVDAKGELTFYNPKFYDPINDVAGIDDIVFLKGKYYATAIFVKDGKKAYSVIDQEGKSVKGFENLNYYPQQKLKYSDDNNVWYFIAAQGDHYELKSLFGNKKFDGITRIDEWNYYDRAFGYVIVEFGNKKGLLDLVSMKWKIKPSQKNDFTGIYYASLENIKTSHNEISSEVIKTNRRIVDVYILNSENKFYDLNLKLYKMKE